MLTGSLTRLSEDLEKQELEAPNGIPTTHVYEQLLAVYLCANDLCNAKYLWKRIPQSVKTSSPELGNIWSVAQHMWKRDFPGIYKALNAVNWSEPISSTMAQVQERVRNNAVDLIAQAYSSITLDTVSAMTGLPTDVCATACVERGWQIEADTRMVHPVRPVQVATGHTSSEDQLYKLTNFVSFLEN